MIGLIGLGAMAGAIAFEGIRENFADIQQGLGLLFLKFGRDDESQSDELGVDYSTQVGYDSHEMANFFGVFRSKLEPEPTIYRNKKERYQDTQYTLNQRKHRRG